MIKHKDASEYVENYAAISDVLTQNNVLERNLGVEVGVRHGVFSEFLLDAHPNLSLLLVDPFLPYMDLGDKFYTEEEQEEILTYARKRLFKFKTRARFILQPSVLVAANMIGCNLDFAFIDAQHTYESVKEDLHAWWRKVRPGGLFSGHDYNNHDVKRAVDEFAASIGRPVQHIGFPSHVWLMEVPKGVATA